MAMQNHSAEAAAIVKKARQLQGLNQHDFGQILGLSQSTVAKYEGGLVPVPGDILIPCMTKLGMVESGSPTAAELAERLRTLLDDPVHAELRKAISVLVESISADRKRRYAGRG